MPKYFADPRLAAVLAGALGPLAFAPLNLWLAALPSVVVLFVLLQDSTARRAATLGWWYGLGYFGVGASWVYVSIHDFGLAPPMLAGFITLAFVAGIALFFALQSWFYRYCLAQLPVTGFAASWVLGEWFRSWFLTGFPWLYLGSAHVTTPLSGVAPVFGVLGISFVIALSAALLGGLWVQVRRDGVQAAVRRTRYPLALLALWLAAVAPLNVAWTQRWGEFNVVVVQADIAQSLKFNSDPIGTNVSRYAQLSDRYWDRDLVVWSETAIPMLVDAAPMVLRSLAGRASERGATLVTGVFARTEDGVHNSVLALGNGSGIWHKQKLVPFGEYTPLRSLLGPALELFALPMSSLVPGPAAQQPLTAGGVTIAPFICYEIVYPDFVRRNAATADLLLTVSNDTWFGASWGPHQHLQMAAMRARENGRWVVRATNSGISALIDERGRIVGQAPQFQPAVLQGPVQLFTGTTPWAWWGDWPLLALCGLLLLWNFYQIRARVPSAGRS